MIAVSVVSHGHGGVVLHLLDQLLSFPEVTQIILTQNIPEEISDNYQDKITVIQNKNPKGFGANHNSAFKITTAPFFCVINPDVIFHENSFSKLINYRDQRFGVIAPLSKNDKGAIQESARYFLSISNLARKWLLGVSDAYVCKFGGDIFYPEWISGAFMLFPRASYVSVGGFDEGFYLYVEDVDICRRLWKNELSVILDPNTFIIHEGHKDSRKNLKFTYLHVRSLCLYFSKILFRHY